MSEIGLVSEVMSHKPIDGKGVDWLVSPGTDINKKVEELGTVSKMAIGLMGTDVSHPHHSCLEALKTLSSENTQESTHRARRALSTVRDSLKSYQSLTDKPPLELPQSTSDSLHALSSTSIEGNDEARTGLKDVLGAFEKRLLDQAKNRENQPLSTDTKSSNLANDWTELIAWKSLIAGKVREVGISSNRQDLIDNADLMAANRLQQIVQGADRGPSLTAYTADIHTMAKIRVTQILNPELTKS